MAKAWDVDGLGPEVVLGVCARRIIATRFAEVLHYRAGTIAGVDIEELHSMRVSTRRLRSAMKNFGACFDPVGLKRHDRQIRRIADALGTVRDLDVRLAWLEAHRAVVPEMEYAGVDLLVGRIREERERRRGPMIGILEQLDQDGYELEFLEFVGGPEAVHG